MLIEMPVTAQNNPAIAGALASQKILFGQFKRYAVYAVHTRFDAVQWFVDDAEKREPLTNLPETIRQNNDFEKAIIGLY